MRRMEDYHRHDLSDEAWERLEEKLPGRRGMWGGIAQDNRRFINGAFWILRTGAPWRDLPPDYGGWKNTHTDDFAVGGIRGFGKICWKRGTGCPRTEGQLR